MTAPYVQHFPPAPHAPDAAPSAPAAPSLSELQRRHDSLLGFIASISSELELRPLLTRILSHACDLIGADNGTIGLLDERRNVVRTEAIYHMPADELGAEMGPGQGLAGEVLLRQRPVVFERYGDVAAPTQPHLAENAVVGVPISWHGRMIGFFGIGTSAPLVQGIRLRRKFSERDVATLTVFARHAAIAIENARRYREERQRTERLELLARLGHIITAGLRLDDVLQRAADAVHELLGYPNIAIPLIEPEDPHTLVLRTVGGHYRHIVTREYRLPISTGIMGAAARSRQVVLVNDVANDARYVPTPQAQGITAELAVPILLGERVLGVLNVEAGEPFAEEDAASLRIAADQLAVAIENARLYERGQRLAALEERHRIARDLHDAVTQQLFGMVLMTRTLASAWRRDPAEGERRTQRLLDAGTAALSEMRALLSELRSAVAADDDAARARDRVLARGLPAALAECIAQLPADDLAVDLAVDGYTPLPADREAALLRITQEALHNVVKHARASRAWVWLGADGATASLRVRDNGVGLARATAAAAHDPAPTGGGLGLSSMRERAARAGGSLRVDSGAAGTEIIVRIPLERIDP